MTSQEHSKVVAILLAHVRKVASDSNTPTMEMVRVLTEVRDVLMREKARQDAAAVDSVSSESTTAKKGKKP